MLKNKLLLIAKSFFFLFLIHIKLQAVDNLVLQWNQVTLDAIKTTSSSPPVASRALAIVHTSMFDAWAAYDSKAIGTRRGITLRRPTAEHTPANKEEAISYAAFRALVDLFPSQQGIFTTFMTNLGYDPSNSVLGFTTPSGIGNLAAHEVLTFRHQDGSNQMGDEPGSTGTPYSNYTGYTSVNTSTLLNDPSRWQPLNIAGQDQVFLLPQWGLVVPFAFNSGTGFFPPPPAVYPSPEYLAQAVEALSLSAQLDDRTKSIVEYWSDGAGTVTPPGHWNVIAQFVSRRDQHTLDYDTKMFFVLNNALFDAGIAAWYVKIFYDSIRPISAIRFLFKDKDVLAWAGPGQGTQVIQGQNWRPYIATPPFGEYVSGHSTFSNAAAEVLRLFTGSDRYDDFFTFVEGSSFVEPGITPSEAVTLTWKTFTQAANQAGRSRRLGGIHF